MQPFLTLLLISITSKQVQNLKSRAIPNMSWKQICINLDSILSSRHLKSLITSTCGIYPTALGLDLSLVFIPYMKFYNSNLYKIDFIGNFKSLAITSIKRWISKFVIFMPRISLEIKRWSCHMFRPLISIFYNTSCSFTF